VEPLEGRIVPSFVDSSGAVVTNLTANPGGTQLTVSFDGPLSLPAGALSATALADFSIQVPTSNPQLVTSITSTVALTSGTYATSGSGSSITLTLGTALTPATFYRVFINGSAATGGNPDPGLTDNKGQPIDGDYDDTPSGNFYGLFASTTAATPLSFTDSAGVPVTLKITGPGQLDAWRALNGDFNATSLASQANLTSGSIQQITVSGGTLATTTLSGTLPPPPPPGPGAPPPPVIVVVPSIAGAGINFTNGLSGNFQLTPLAVPPNAPTPIVATSSNLPYTLQIRQITAPTLPGIHSAVDAVNRVSGSQFEGYWLLFGGRTNGLHGFNPDAGSNFPPTNQNQDIIVINPANWQSWTLPWSSTDIPAAVTAPLYSTNQQSFQDGDTLYTSGGYGATDQGASVFSAYQTYNTLTAFSVDGLIKAVVNGGSAATQSQLQQISDPRFQVTGGEMKKLGNEAVLALGHNFQGDYIDFANFTQTYISEIRSFQINYDGSVPGSLSISNYQAMNDQTDLRRRDYILGDVMQSPTTEALQIYGGVFTPGPQGGGGYSNPIAIPNATSIDVGTYQQYFSQYTAPIVPMYDAVSGSMYSMFLGGLSAYDYDFATGTLTFDPNLPFVDDVTTLVQAANGSMQEYEMPSHLPGLYGSNAKFFEASGLPTYSNDVIKLDQLTQPTTLGYMYGGIHSTLPNTSNQATQTSATNALFELVLVPSSFAQAPTVTLDSAATNPTSLGVIPATATFSTPVTGLTAADISATNGTVSNVQVVNPVNGFATTWTFSLTPTAPGTVTAVVNADATQNEGGTGNTASNTFSIVSTPPVLAVGNGGGTVRIINATNGATLTTVRPLDAGTALYSGLVGVALGDFNGDTVADLAVSAADARGVNGLDATKAGKVFVYDGTALAKGTLSLIQTFTPFANHDGPNGTSGAYTNGLNIAAGDVNGDGHVDLIAGTRGGNGTTSGQVEFGRLVVIDGTSPAGTNTVIGGIQTPFGSGYQKGVIVAAGNVDGAGGDEIAVTRGGPVASSNPAVQAIKVKVLQLQGTALTELHLAADGSTAFAPFAGLTGAASGINRDGRVAFVDTDGNGQAELVFAALDPLTNPANEQVRLGVYAINASASSSGATIVSTGPDAGTYRTGNAVVDQAITHTAGTGAQQNLAMITQSASSGIVYLAPLTGVVQTGGFSLDIISGGISIDGI